MIKRNSAVAAGLMLLLGCSSPAPEPASADAVERAVAEAERQAEATHAASERRIAEAEAVQSEGKTT